VALYIVPLTGLGSCRSSGPSLKLGAFVALAGPPDLLVRCADRSEPIELHPRPWRFIS